MPNRIIRESMLDSTRYLSVDEGAQLLFNHLLLLADDFGCLSIEPAFIGRRCFNVRPTEERLAELLGQLIEADLIRDYEYKRQHYAFIPRFRQRLKRETLKNPQPPDDLLFDDLEAQDKFRKLNGHQYKGTAIGRPEGGPQSAGGRPEDAGGYPAAQQGRKDLGIESEKEVNPAPSTDTRNPVDMAAALAEKMRLKENSKD